MEEIDVTLMLNKQMTLRSTSADAVACQVHVFECEDPYALIFMITKPDDQQQCRLDVSKDDISTQLKNWLKGDFVDNACLVSSTSIQESIVKYVKLGATPKPAVLASWILSRCVLQTSPIFSITLVKNDIGEVSGSLGSPTTFLTKTSELVIPPSNTYHATIQASDATGKDVNMIALAQTMMGRSVALSELRQRSRSSRKDAIAVVDFSTLTDDHFRLGCDISYGRKQVEERLQARRRLIAINNARQAQRIRKLSGIRGALKQATEGNAWVKKATDEVIALTEMEKNIEEDIKKQRIRGEREMQLLSWTMVPNGCNLGGRWQQGIVIGQGPLPSEATTNQRDPRIDRILGRFYWDKAGRRHAIGEIDDDSKSMVEKALETIRQLAASPTLKFKLNLKSIFQSLDQSGDGIISITEFVEGMKSLGVPLDMESLEALFR